MSDDLIVKAAGLIDGTGGPRLRSVQVRVTNGLIVSVGPANNEPADPRARVLDLGDCTLLPGFVDAHMHFFGVPSHQLDRLVTENDAYRALRAAGEARRMLEAGVTAARCLGSSVSPSLRRAIDEGHVPGPRLQVAGQFVCSTGGTWDNLSLPLDLMARAGMIADGPDAVRAVVRRRIRDGSTVIKLGLSKGRASDSYHAWGDDPYRQGTGYSLAEVRAAAEEAHASGLKVSAHCIGEQAVSLALDGGVDVIEHGYGITSETRDRLAETGTIVVSTLSQIFFHLAAEDEYRYHDWEKRAYRAHDEAMRSDFAAGVARGVRFALGTDLIGYPTHPQDRAAKEFELAAASGMTPMEAIVAGTRISAEALGMADVIGTIEPGKAADIVAVAADPLKDIRALQDPSFVMKAGQVIRAQS